MEKIELTKEQLNYIGTWLNIYDEKRFGDSAMSYEWDDNEPFNIEQDYIYLVKHAIKAYNGGDRYTLNSRQEIWDMIQSETFPKLAKDHPLYGLPSIETE